MSSDSSTRNRDKPRLPAFFVHEEVEVRQGGRSYDQLGYHLARYARALVERGSLVEQLDALLHEPDEYLLVAWFHRALPACMVRVPIRSLRSFMAGVMSAVENGEMDDPFATNQRPGPL